MTTEPGSSSTDYLRPASTISDLEWVLAIAGLGDLGPGGSRWVMVWDLAEHFRIHPNRIRSKARRARRRGLSDGCICGCRGDFELLRRGEELLRASLDA